MGVGSLIVQCVGKWLGDSGRIGLGVSAVNDTEEAVGFWTAMHEAGYVVWNHRDREALMTLRQQGLLAKETVKGTYFEDTRNKRAMLRDDIAIALAKYAMRTYLDS